MQHMFLFQNHYSHISHPYSPTSKRQDRAINRPIIFLYYTNHRKEHNILFPLDRTTQEEQT